MAARAFITKVLFRPKVKLLGAVKVRLLSGPILTVIVRVMLWPPSDVKGIVKVVVP